MVTTYQDTHSKSLIVVIDFRAVASVIFNNISSIFFNKQIICSDESILNEIIIKLQKDLLKNLFELYNNRELLEYDNQAKSKLTNYDTENIYITDRLIFDLGFIGLNLKNDEALNVVHSSEMLIITELGNIIPNIDERAVVIRNTHYKYPFTFYVYLDLISNESPI